MLIMCSIVVTVDLLSGAFPGGPNHYLTDGIISLVVTIGLIGFWWIVTKKMGSRDQKQD